MQVSVLFNPNWYWTWLCFWLKYITSSTSYWKIRLFFAFVPFSWDLDERSNRERPRPHQEAPSPCRKLCLIPLTGNPLSIHRALEIWADCWKWTLSAGRERKQKVANSCSTFLVGKGTRRKGTVWSSGLSIPFIPRQVSCESNTVFIEVNVTVLPLMLLFCQ